MKRIMFAVTLGLCLAMAPTAVSFAQYRIYGHVPDLEDGMMYLEMSGKAVDSAKVEKGCFTFDNKNGMEAPTYVHMRHSSNRWQCSYWMGNDNIDFTTVNDMPVIKGSQTQDEYEEYRRVLEPAWNVGRKLKASITDVAKADSLSRLYEAKYKAMEDSLFMEYAKRFPSSYITLNHIYNMRLWSKYPFKRYSKFAKIMTPGAFKGKQWRTFTEVYGKDEELEPGHPMPKFVMNNVYGKAIDIAAMKGKFVLLTVSTYGVKDYDADLELRKKLYEKYHDKGLEMVDYSLSQEMHGVIKAPVNMGLRWHFVTDLKGFNGPWIKEHEIDHTTQNFLIDRNGIIIGRNLFGEELEREISKLF